ncbi:uncharacterized protein LOC127954286 isoform X1 [Carassius gibelio]|uniref:uncharacterized protein LOC127954286 isoform X1 n=1 Tax=Carassius gibelio TaxID=101364 RepID=UPI0022797B91|nr:uncharacterized protein LOC127954286 isoform X1 [Carassius gibelio]
MTTTVGNISEGFNTTKFDNVSQSIPDSRQVKNHSANTASRPDWILYTVPASAFLIGIVLFTYVCKTQQSRNAPAKQRTNTNEHFATYTDFGYTKSNTQRHMETNENKKDDTQSYENVEAAIYSNQDKVTYYVSADEDYLNPDEMGEEEVVGPEDLHNNTLRLPSNLTDTGRCTSSISVSSSLQMESRMRTWRGVYMLSLAHRHSSSSMTLKKRTISILTMIENKISLWTKQTPSRMKLWLDQTVHITWRMIHMNR